MTPAWTVWLNLIITQGIPAAHKIWQLTQSKDAPTEEDWIALETLAQKRAEDYLAEARARVGMD